MFWSCRDLLQRKNGREEKTSKKEAVAGCVFRNKKKGRKRREAREMLLGSCILVIHTSLQYKFSSLAIFKCFVCLQLDLALEK